MKINGVSVGLYVRAAAAARTYRPTDTPLIFICKRIVIEIEGLIFSEWPLAPFKESVLSLCLLIGQPQN